MIDAQIFGWRAVSRGSALRVLVLRHLRRLRSSDSFFEWKRAVAMSRWDGCVAIRRAVSTLRLVRVTFQEWGRRTRGAHRRLRVADMLRSRGFDNRSGCSCLFPDKA